MAAVRRCCAERALVVVADSGGAAEELLAEQPAPRAAIVGHSLAGADGFDVVAEVQRHNARAEVLVLMRRFARQAANRAIAMGVGYTVLPIESPCLDAVLSRAGVGRAGTADRPRDRLDEVSDELGLKARERDVLRLRIDGHQAKSIAEKLGLSRHTVFDVFERIRIKADMEDEDMAEVVRRYHCGEALPRPTR